MEAAVRKAFVDEEISLEDGWLMLVAFSSMRFDEKFTRMDSEEIRRGELNDFDRRIVEIDGERMFVFGFHECRRLRSFRGDFFKRDEWIEKFGVDDE